MGLDMQLFKKDIDGNPINVETRTYGTNEEYEYEKEFIYWRKVNAIHAWFVREVMDGNDANDGSDYPVSVQKLLEFYEQLVEARLTRNVNIFPPTGGFFFGSDKVDEYYWEELLSTVEQLQKDIIDIRSYIEDGELEQYPYTYWYNSSW